MNDNAIDMQDRLDVRKSKVIACMAHPGFAGSSFGTNALGHNSNLALRFIKDQLMRFAQSEEDGTMPLLQCMLGAAVGPRTFCRPSQAGLWGRLRGDKYYGPPETFEAEPHCKSAAAKDMLWQQSEKACGPFFA